MLPTNSLERALLLLDMVGRHSGGLSNSEISRRLKIATSTSSYILSRLEREGYLTRDRQSGRYEIGLKVVGLAQGALREMGLRQIAEPALHRLAGATRLSANIGILDRGCVMLVDRVASPEFIKVDVSIGTRMPLHSTALGKILIAHLPDAKVTALVEKQGLVMTTPKTIASVAALLQELERTRARGYAIADEEEFPGVRSIAAPILDPLDKVVASVAAAGTTLQTIWKHKERVVEAVLWAAHEISKNGRFRPQTLKAIERHADPAGES